MAKATTATRVRQALTPHGDRLLGASVGIALCAYTVAIAGRAAAALAGAALAALMGAALALRRRAPVTAGVTIAVAVSAYEIVVADAGPVLLVPLLLGLYSIGVHAPRARSAVGFGLACAVLSASFLVERKSVEAWLENTLFVVLVAGSVWGAGVAVRGSRRRAALLADLAAQLEREREEKARLAVAGERARIARELHDVVAHAISVIAVQAGAGRHVFPGDEERAREAFTAIESTARQSLVEMRRLLGLLREDERVTAAPMPGLRDHAELVEHARRAGLDVRLEVRGAADRLPPGIDLAAYRILQEALTNVRKHAPGSRVHVGIRYGARDLEIDVHDDGSRAGGASPDGSGHGLIGMRERVALYGGELAAGPLPAGGFHVTARLPLREDAG